MKMILLSFLIKILKLRKDILKGLFSDLKLRKRNTKISDVMGLSFLIPAMGL